MHTSKRISASNIGDLSIFDSTWYKSIVLFRLRSIKANLTWHYYVITHATGGNFTSSSWMYLYASRLADWLAAAVVITVCLQDHKIHDINTRHHCGTCKSTLCKPNNIIAGSAKPHKITLQARSRNCVLLMPDAYTRLVRVTCYITCPAR